MPSIARKFHPSRFRPHLLALALAATLPLPTSAWADAPVFGGTLRTLGPGVLAISGPTIKLNPTVPHFDGSLGNPAVANAYTGLATPEKLAAAMSGLRPLIAELPLILPPGSCWDCGTYGVIVSTGPGYGGGHIDFGSSGPTPGLISAGSDADLGALGAPVTLAFSRLQLSGSFETGRDFIIGSSAYGPTYSPSNQLWFIELPPVSQPHFADSYFAPEQTVGLDLLEDGQWLYVPVVHEEGITPDYIDPSSFIMQVAAPASPGGSGWIDTAGHDLKITGVVTSHQTLYKEGEGTLWLTGANVWNAAPEVMAGVLKGDAASLNSDIFNQSLVSFAQGVDGTYYHVISGTGALEKTGAGMLTLTRAQTYGGATDLREGTLALGYGGQLPDQTRLSIEAGATLDISGVDYAASIDSLAGEGDVILGDKRLILNPSGEQPHTFSGVISGAGKVILSYGGGTQRFTGNNTYAGGTLLQGWNTRLEIAGDASLGAPAAAVEFEGGTLAVLASLTTARTFLIRGQGTLDSNGHDITLLSGLQGTGAFSKKGAGTLFVTTDTEFYGSVTVAEGTLALLGAGALNPASHVSVESAVLDLSGADGDRRLRSVSGYDGAEIRLGGNSLILNGGWGVFNGVISGQGGLTLDGTNSFQTLTGVNTYTGATTILAGTLRARAPSLSDRVINNGRLELFDYGDEDSISAYSGDISGTGMLVKTDKSAIWLRGHNSYTGGTVVEKGVLIGNTDSLQGNIETRAGLAFYQVADGTYAGRVSGTGTLMSYGPGALTLTGDNTHTGGTAFSNTLRISRDANLGGAQSGLLIAGGTLVALDNLSLNRHVALGAAGARFDSNGYSITLNGRIDGPGGVTKLGDGVLYLAGEHGYTGMTRVERGGMVVNGSFAGDVEVLDGAWFEAKGRIGGDLNIAEGALFSAGNSPGTLVVDGDFIAAGDILVEIAGPDVHDFTQVGGVADLTGARIHFTLLDGALPGDLVGMSFLSAAGGIIGLDSATYIFDAGLDGYRVALVGNSLQLAPVPEPETWALLLAGLGLVGWTTRARRAR
ncbi:MAG: hypothetical protein B7Y41_05025 [Hydrogenophilales bacterium 28-61-23]|nr:MAG: hypothetical protein B7Y41_05025 [Hydrogenophilales bacterium 28-61-23]